MLKLFVLLIAVAAVWGLSRPDKLSFKILGRPTPSIRIAGGHDADIADYPYTLALTDHGYFICGAVLISSKWAVTAKHCTKSREAKDLAVIAGSTDLTGGQTVQVATIYEHPRHTSSNLDYDISVLELAEDVTVENSTPIPLHDSGYTAEEGEDVTVTGWGATDYIDHHFPDVLQVVVSKVISNKVCKDAYAWLEPISDTVMCDGVLEGGKGACDGDSGGPVVVGGKLYGTVSWGRCGREDSPTVNSKISEPSMREFVRNVTGI